MKKYFDKVISRSHIDDSRILTSFERNLFSIRNTVHIMIKYVQLTYTKLKVSYAWQTYPNY